MAGGNDEPRQGGIDALLNELDTIQGTATEGVLYLTHADYAAFNTAGAGLFEAWDAEPGHHVQLVLLGDYNNDGVVDAADYTVYRDNLGAPGDTLPNHNDLGGRWQRTLRHLEGSLRHERAAYAPHLRRGPRASNAAARLPGAGRPRHALPKEVNHAKAHHNNRGSAGDVLTPTAAQESHLASGRVTRAIVPAT